VHALHCGGTVGDSGVAPWGYLLPLRERRGSGRGSPYIQPEMPGQQGPHDGTHYRCPNSAGCLFSPQSGTFLARPTHGTTQLRSCPGWHGPIRVPGLGAICGPHALDWPGMDNGPAVLSPCPISQKPNPRDLAQATAPSSTAPS
jgi:hypothetical protein